MHTRRYTQVTIRTRRVLALAVLAMIGLGASAEAQLIKGMKVISSDARELTFELRPRVTIGTVDGGGIYPRIDGAHIVNLNHPGSPLRMSIGVPVALPGPSGNALEIVSVEYGDPQPGVIAPVPRLVTGPDGMANEIYKPDPAAFARPWDAAPAATFRYDGIARNLHKGTIDVEPYRYDPTARAIRYLRSITVRLRYGSVPAAATRVDIGGAARSLFPNAQVASAWGIARPAMAPLSLNKPTTAAARAWFRVEVRDNGLTALTADDFKAAGVEISTLDPNKIAVYGGTGADMPESTLRADSNQMHQVPTIVETTDGRVSRVLFYGVGPNYWSYDSGDTIPHHHISPYVVANSYIVAVDGDPTMGFPRKEVPAGNPTVAPSTGIGRVYLEEEKVNAIDIDPSAGGSGRDWFGDEFRIDVPNMPVSRVYSTTLPMLDRSQPITYTVRVAQSAKGTSGVPNYFTIKQNNQEIQSIPLYPFSKEDESIASAAKSTFTAPGAQVQGNNVSLLSLSYNSPMVASGFLDWVEFHYARQLAADGDQIVFDAPTGSELARYTITNFSNTGDVVVLDITDPANPKQLAIDSREGGSVSFVDQLHARRESARYYVGRISTSRRPTAVARAPFADLRGRMLNADILVVTHDDFRSVADKYVKYRNAQGVLKAAFVTTSEIYTEFSHGNLDPTAIRDYVAFAFKKWGVAPRYVLLIGDGSYDYRNLATKQPQYVPTYESAGSDIYNANYSLAYDDYYACIIGPKDSTTDYVVDLALGRLPIESVAQGETVLEKLKSYEVSANYGLWRQTVILAADDAYQWGSTDDFITQSEGIWKFETPGWVEPRKIYLSLYPTVQVTARRKPAAEQDLMQFIEQGAVITNWLGHGNPNVWAHEYLLQKDEFIPRLTNDSMLTFVTAATCNFGNFDDPSLVSGGEMFLLQPNGGAVAVMTSTRASYITPNQYLITAYFDAIYRRDGTTGERLSIGEALEAAKQATSGNFQNNQKFVIFGDPSLMLNFPKDSIEIVSIDTTAVSTGIATVGALSVVKVDGVVRNVATGGVREDFNGRVIVTLYDADRYLSVVDSDFRQNLELYGGRLFRGPAQVSNGRFSVTFRVPKDIAFDTATARLHAYAFAGREDATGATTHVRVYGSDTSKITDNSGPDLKIFLDDRTFRSGDMVTSKPMLIVDLQDSSGINSSGSGLGHKIEAWVDDNPTSLNLTDLYQSDITSYRKGTSERQLTGLSPGEHSVKVRAWDIFNNPTDGNALFRIAEGPDQALQVVDVVNFPNPMERETDFLFRHNQTRPVDVDIAIFTNTGRKVRQLEARSVTDRFVRVHWDGTDTDGDRLANGVYFYRLRVRVAGDETGQEYETIEKVAIVK